MANGIWITVESTTEFCWNIIDTEWYSMVFNGIPLAVFLRELIYNCVFTRARIHKCTHARTHADVCVYELTPFSRIKLYFLFCGRCECIPHVYMLCRWNEDFTPNQDVFTCLRSPVAQWKNATATSYISQHRLILKNQYNYVLSTRTNRTQELQHYVLRGIGPYIGSGKCHFAML